jgi:topoisomerase-4 subunit A
LKANILYNITEKGGNNTTKVTGMYKVGFLDYAYVILERAVPAIEDGFKPVQRRIMHSLRIR